MDTVKEIVKWTKHRNNTKVYEALRSVQKSQGAYSTNALRLKEWRIKELFRKMNSRRSWRLAHNLLDWGERADQLMHVFPLLGVLLYDPYLRPLAKQGGWELKAEALRMVDRGEKLNKIAGLFGIPSILRKVPSERVTQFIENLRLFTPEIAKTFPQDEGDVDSWCEVFNSECRDVHMRDGRLVNGNTIILWLLMKQHYKDFYKGRTTSTKVTTILDYLRNNPDVELSPNLSAHRLEERIEAWHLETTKQRNAQDLVPFELADRLSTETYGDYEVVPLKTPYDLRREGEAQRHCVASYAGRCRDRTIILSVRKDWKVEATAEFIVGSLGLHTLHGRFNQVSAFANHSPDREIRKILNSWETDMRIGLAKVKERVIKAKAEQQQQQQQKLETLRMSRQEYERMKWLHGSSVFKNYNVVTW